MYGRDAWEFIMINYYSPIMIKKDYSPIVKFSVVHIAVKFSDSVHISDFSHVASQYVNTYDKD